MALDRGSEATRAPDSGRETGILPSVDSPDSQQYQHLAILIDLAQLQHKANRLHKQLDTLLARRTRLVRDLFMAGMELRQIHELTHIPLSTLYNVTIDLRRRGSSDSH
jgi:hypothetical protein